MIARIWRGATEAVKTDEYFDYLNKTGIPDYRATKGNCGVFVLRRIENDEAHFLLLTLWKSVEAIKNFAGSEIEQARYYPEDEKFLLELDPNVRHFDVWIKGETKRLYERNFGHQCAIEFRLKTASRREALRR